MIGVEVMPMSEWLKVRDVAELLRVDPETVRRWLRNGALKGSLLSDRGGWRIQRSEVDRFMQEREGPQDLKTAA